MPNEYEVARPAASASRTTTMSRPTIPPPTDSNDTAAAEAPRRAGSDAPSMAQATERRTPPRPSRPLVVGLGMLVAALLLVLLADVGRGTADSHGKAAATPTATATATATVPPSPTPMSGFQVYTDLAQGFLLQYPAKWTPTPLSGEVDFKDTNNADLSFEMFVLLPNPDLLPSQETDAQSAAAWVDHVLNTETQLHGSEFVRMAGPIPAGHFANADWQSGIGLLGEGAAQVRIQVYVTIHQGRPYVIGLAANNTAFDFANQDYFDAMLQSFSFLSSAP